MYRGNRYFWFRSDFGPDRTSPAACRHGPRASNLRRGESEAEISTSYIDQTQGTPLRAVRRERKLRLEDLSWLVFVTTNRRVSIATLSRLERGEIDSSPRTKAAIARALKVSPETLWPTG